MVGSFGGYKDAMDVHKNHTQSQFVSTLVDDLGGSLGRYGYYASPSGVSDGHGNICVYAYYIAIKDSYDFNDDPTSLNPTTWVSQPLGFWGPYHSHPVANSDFNKWRRSSGRGGDFEVWSDMKTELIEPFEVVK